MKTYHNGPVRDQQRSCTDCFCCFLLTLLVIGMLGLGIYSWTRNNFNKLTTPYDSEGKGCGVDYPDYPLIYFVSPQYDALWRTVCVKKCPTEGQKSLDCYPNKYITTCNERVDADSQKAINIYDTVPISNTICFPSSVSLQEKISGALGNNNWQQKITSLAKVWKILLISIPIAVLLSSIFMLVVRFTAGFFIYILLAISFIALIALGVYLIITPVDALSGMGVNKTFAYVLGGICILLGVVIGIAVLCYRNRIRLAALIVETSAKFAKQNCCVAFFPFIIFIFLMLYLALWILQALGIYSMGQPVTQEKQLPFQHFNMTTFSYSMIFVHIFHLFWMVCFFIEANDFIMSGTATSWYFKRPSPLSQSFHRFRRFHIGSVAFASFIMALVGFIKFMFELLVPEKAEQGTFKNNCKRFCDCCCFICATYLFKCINSGAFTYIHLASDSYCNSALEVAGTKLKNPVLTGVVSFMGVLFSILIRLGIPALTVFICYIIMKNVEPYKAQQTSTTIPNIFIGIIAFAISSLFVSLYSEATQTIYTCFLLDSEAGGSNDKSPEEFQEFLSIAKRQGHFVQ